MEVNSFWADELTALERLCMSSFVQSGITYNLYVYDEPAGVPAGVAVRDASEILPRDQVFRYNAGNFNRGSVSGFSNLFRYSVIHQRGGWWIDTDICFLRDFDQPAAHVFFRAPRQTKEFAIASAIFKAPAGSPTLARCLDEFRKKDVSQIVHGETGPTLLTQCVLASGNQSPVLPSQHVFPVPWWEFQKLFFDEELSLDDASAVHFWNAMVTDARLDKNSSFPPNGAFERLKRRYL